MVGVVGSSPIAPTKQSKPDTDESVSGFLLPLAPQLLVNIEFFHCL